MFSEKILSVTPDTFVSEVLQSDRPVLIDFWASWCGPCKMLARRLEEFAELHGARVKVVSFNAEAHRDAALALGVKTLPTLQLYRQGERVATASGPLALTLLRAQLQPLTENASP